MALGFVLTLTSCGYGLNTGNDEDRASWQAAEERASEEERAEARRGVLLDGLREGSVPMAVTTSSTSTTTTEPSPQPFTPAPPTDPPTTTTTTTTAPPTTTTTTAPPPPPPPLPPVATPVRVLPSWCSDRGPVGEVGARFVGALDPSATEETIDTLVEMLRGIRSETGSRAVSDSVTAFIRALADARQGLQAIDDPRDLRSAVNDFVETNVGIIDAYTEATEAACDPARLA